MWRFICLLLLDHKWVTYHYSWLQARDFQRCDRCGDKRSVPRGTGE